MVAMKKSILVYLQGFNDPVSLPAFPQIQKYHLQCTEHKMIFNLLCATTPSYKFLFRILLPLPQKGRHEVPMAMANKRGKQKNGMKKKTWGQLQLAPNQL